MANDKQIRHAFAAGALEKLAEADISPNKFVQAAQNTNDPQMRKIASAILELDADLQYEEQQKVANMLRQQRQ